MLSAAFTEEKDSVLYVDLLTYTDLDLLKARKNGTNSVMKSNPQAIQSNKRYVILTYSGNVRHKNDTTHKITQNARNKIIWNKINLIKLP